MVHSGRKFIRRSVLFLTILCSILPAFLTAQTPEQSYAFALYESRQGNYDIAIKSLKRIQFFDDQNKFPGVYKELADCYFLKANYEDAYYYYDLASVQAQSDSILPDIIARKVTCKLFERQYPEALIDLMSYSNNLNDLQQLQFDLLYGMTYFYLGDYNTSKLYFLKSTDTSNLELVAALNSDFNRIRKIEKKYSPTRSRLLSIFIPGSGQMMAGDYHEGLNSLLLITGLITAGVAITGSLSVFDSFVIVGPWFQRYYMGGYQKAYEITKAKQQYEKNKILAHIIHFLDQPALQ